MSERIPEGFTEVVIHFDVPNSAGDVQCAFGVDAAVGPADTALHAAIDTCVANLVGIASEAVAVHRLSYIVGEDAGDLTYDRAIEEQGQRAPDNNPANVSALIQKRGAVGGRRNRGRMYIPCPADADVEGTGLLGSTAMGLFETFCLDALTALDTASMSMVILHQVTPFTPSPVTTLLPQQLVATQRGRLR